MTKALFGAFVMVVCAACAGEGPLAPSTVGGPAAKVIAESSGTTISAARKDESQLPFGLTTRVTHGFVTSVSRFESHFDIGGDKGFKFDVFNDQAPSVFSGVVIFAGQTFNLGFPSCCNYQGTLKYQGVERAIHGGYSGDSRGVLVFSAPTTFTVPLIMEASLHFSAPFTMTGTVGYLCCTPPESFGTNLTGSGIAEIHLEAIPGVPQYRIVEVRYDFTGAPPKVG